LTGDAKAVSVNMLMSENKRIMSRQAKQYEILNARLKPSSMGGKIVKVRPALNLWT